MAETGLREGGLRGWVVSTCIIPRPHFCPQLLWLFISKLSFEHKREFLSEFRNSSGRYFFPQCPNTRRATGGDNQVSSVFWICCLCMLYTSCPFPTVVEYIHFLWATDFLWCAWFSLALFLCVCVCVRMHVYVLFPLWMNASSFLGLLTFYGVLGFHLPSFFFLCVCVRARVHVCVLFLLMNASIFLGLLTFYGVLGFHFPSCFFLCVPNVSVVQLIQVRSYMYELSSWCKLDLTVACIICPACISCTGDAS